MYYKAKHGSFLVASKECGLEINTEKTWTHFHT